MHRSLVMLGATLASSLALWSLFWTQGMPLTSSETLVVVGVCAAAVYGARWSVAAIVRRRLPVPPAASAGASVAGHAGADAPAGAAAVQAAPARDGDA